MKISFLLAGVLALVSICRADAVRLKLVGPDGKPVAGAKVHIVEIGVAGGTPKPEKPLDLTSDAAGQVAFDSKTTLPDPKSTDWHNRTYLSAQVRAGGMALAQLELKKGDNALTLKAGRALSGVVLGGDERPVAGVKIVLRSLLSPDQKVREQAYFSDDASYGMSAPFGVSDRSGKWTIDALPLVGTAGVSIADPRFKNESFLFDLGQGAPPLFVERGARLKGRLLKPDGTGAGDVSFYVGNAMSLPKTGADGTFEVSGLGEEHLDLQALSFMNGNLPFIVPMKSVDGLKIGQTLDIGDWKTQAGDHVRGKVVDADTQKPIEGASVEIFGRTEVNQGTSKEDGAFDFVTAGASTSLSASATGYISLSKQSVPDAKDGVVELGTLALKHGFQISGTAKNQVGAPATGMLYAEKNGQRSYARISDEDGTFTFEGLEAGDYTVKSDDLKIVSGDKFSVGAAKAAPLSLVVEGTEKNSAALRVEGHVFDDNGRPLAGAKIKLKMQRSPGWTEPQTVVSGLDGRYSATLPVRSATPKIASVSRPGWIFGGAPLTLGGETWRGDITLQKRGAALRGRIVDAGGKGVPHAFVGLLNSHDLPVETDANGTFVLGDAPARSAKLMASDGSRLVAFEAGAATKPIVLPDAAPVTDKAAMADDLLASALLGSEWEDQWDTLGARRIETVFARAREGRFGETNWNRFLRILARRNPTDFLQRAAQLQEETPRGSQSEFERLLMLVRAQSNDETERAKAKSWLTAQEKEKRGLTSGAVTDLLGAAQVGAKLDAKSGALWLDYALQIAGQLPDVTDVENWGQLAASISPDAPAKFLEERSPASSIQILLGAMKTYEEKGDVDSAKLGFARIETLAALAAKLAQGTVNAGDYGKKPAQLLSKARALLARTLAPTDSKAALEAALLVEDWSQAPVLLVVARSAVKSHEQETARRALRKLADLQRGNGDYAAQAAELAQSFDPALAETLWVRAYSKATPKDGDDTDDYLSIAAYAKARAGQKAGESRILIEREWQTRVETAPKKNADDWDFNGQAMSKLAVAMARVAPRRALEMGEQIPEKQNLRMETRGQIALALLGEE